MSLSNLENEFQRYVLTENEGFVDRTVSTKQLPSKPRLDVYKTGYVLRLLEIIEMDYPVTQKLLGNDEFDRLARTYIEKCPSTHFNIRYFDTKFYQFLAEQADVSSLIVDIAKFECLLEQVLVTADAGLISFDDLATVPPEDWDSLELVLHPSVTQVAFNFPVADIYLAVKDEQEPSVDHPTAKHEVAFWRYETTPYFLNLEPAQAWMLRAIAEECDFGMICQGLTEWYAADEVGQVAAMNLQQWLANGMISSFRT